MPKRSLDLTSPVAMDLERAQKKTERSHEENQERAYIAASRRADRSIEARVQSARMASEIHKKRTGRGFKVSEEIVMKEEMYEEEDDDLPRHYRALTAHLQTSSEDMNNRLNAYITNQVAMRTLARHQEVNRRFSESFPNLCQASPVAQSAYFQPLQGSHNHAAATQLPASHPSLNHSRSKSISHPPMTSPMSQRRPSVPGNQSMYTVQLSAPTGERLSTPSLTPSSADSDTSQSHSPIFPHNQPYHVTVMPPMQPGLIDPALASISGSPHHSSFTAELPQETKDLANIDLSDPFAGAFFGMPHDLTGAAGVDMSQFAPPVPIAGVDAYAPDDQPLGVPDAGLGASGLQPPKSFPDFVSRGSRIGTPGGGDGDSWDAWLNTDELGKLDTEVRA